MKLFLICSLVLLISMTITWIIRIYAVRKNILDIPNERSSHKIPTPRGGGLSFVILFSASTLIMGMNNAINLNLTMALLGGILVALVGYMDDLHKINPICRILVHFSAACWASYWLKGLPILDLGTWQFALNNSGYILAIVSIMWLINLYNFMDGIDGLAGTQALFATISAVLILSFLQDNQVMWLLAILGASIAGFTALNWPPAKIFMGDVGSGYLGYIFAVFALYTTNAHILPVYFWVIIFVIFICDATFTLLFRACRGKKWYSAHRDHAYQKLVLRGVTHQKVTLSILLINMIFILPIAFIALQWRTYAFTIIMILIFSLLLTWIKIKLLRTIDI